MESGSSAPAEAAAASGPDRGCPHGSHGLTPRQVAMLAAACAAVQQTIDGEDEPTLMSGSGFDRTEVATLAHRFDRVHWLGQGAAWTCHMSPEAGSWMSHLLGCPHPLRA